MYTSKQNSCENFASTEMSHIQRYLANARILIVAVPGKNRGRYKTWTLDWTMDWIMDWIMDSILDLILDQTALCMN